MKLGISDFAFPSNWSLDRIFATAAEVGFDGVELGLSENGSVSLNSTMEEMQNIRKLADKYGINFCFLLLKCGILLTRPTAIMWEPILISETWFILVIRNSGFGFSEIASGKYI